MTKVLGGGALLLIAIIVVGAFGALHATTSPYAPVQPPEFSFSEPYTANQYDVLESNIEALLAQQQVYKVKVADGETQGTKNDEATKTSIAWTVSVKNGMCNGSIASTHTKEDGTIVNVNEELNDGLSSNCEEMDILLMFIRWIRKAIENKLGIPTITFVVNEVFEFIIKKMNFQSLLPGDFWIMISQQLNP